MFDHVGIVVADLAGSRELYSTVLGALGYDLMEDNSQTDNNGWLVYGPGGDAPFFVVAADRPSFWAPAHATARSPIHCAFVARSERAVEQFHTLGLTYGAKDNGKPGDRGRGYYAAYLIDLDGNNIEAGFRQPQD